MNTWPDNIKRALDQSDHIKWNSSNYPGTRQLCCCCDNPTGRCEEDSLYLNAEFEHQSDMGPLCDECYEERLNNYKEPNG